VKKFNITGLCVPHMHYMVDTSAKIDRIARMVDEGLYFTINRARQYGKTTTFYLLARKLAGDYYVADTSFEGMGEDTFKTQTKFSPMIVSNLVKGLKTGNASANMLEFLTAQKPKSIHALDGVITELCELSDKPIVLMIDEVDQTSHNQNFLDFLGMLRAKYLERNKGAGYTFQSVILAGVYDVKNLKRKITITGEAISASSGGRVYNSLWNIAADFKIDMSFKPAEIATMLSQYESERHVGMDIREISVRIYKYTNGYPFLVSKICKLIHEELDGDWTADSVHKAVKLLTVEQNTLFDDLSKNIFNNRKLRELVYAILIDGVEIPFSIRQPEVELGAMYGILADHGGQTVIANEVFELVIADFLSADVQVNNLFRSPVVKESVMDGVKFSMESALEKFAQHFYEIYAERDRGFIERECRMLFYTYLKPFINGRGFMHIETETRNTLRMDLIVEYLNQQFIVELKLWHGGKRHEEAYDQLCRYLDSKHKTEGYLLTFDFNKCPQPTKMEWVEWHGKRIYDVIVGS
jgi:hypothetical protein